MTPHDAIFLSGAECFRKGIPMMCSPKVLPGFSRQAVKDEWQRGWKAARDAREQMLKDMAAELGFSESRIAAWWPA